MHVPQFVRANPVMPLRASSDASVSLAGRYVAIAQLADDQQRVVRVNQLVSAGWRPDHIEREIHQGRWTRVAPEVIALQNAPLAAHQRMWLGVLHAGPDAAISHTTACNEHGLKNWESDLVEVITRKSNSVSKLSSFFFHETRRDYVDWIHPASSPPRLRIAPAALLAAERKRSIRAGIALLASAVQQRMTRADDLLVASFDIRKLRHGHHFRVALCDIAGGAQALSELDVARICREAGLVEPDRQSIRFDRDGRRRYLDCEWRLPDGRRVVLEIDGGIHLRPENWWRDMRRERDLVLDGALVLRCSTLEVRYDPGAIVADLAAAGVPFVS